jgi:hypothetical protein
MSSSSHNSRDVAGVIGGSGRTNTSPYKHRRQRDESSTQLFRPLIIENVEFLQQQPPHNQQQQQQQQQQRSYYSAVELKNSTRNGPPQYNTANAARPPSAQLQQQLGSRSTTQQMQLPIMGRNNTYNHNNNISSLTKGAVGQKVYTTQQQPYTAPPPQLAYNYYHHQKKNGSSNLPTRTEPLSTSNTTTQLTNDDIERAFRAALSDPYMLQSGGQQQHPLERDATTTATPLTATLTTQQQHPGGSSNKYGSMSKTNHNKIPPRSHRRVNSDTTSGHPPPSHKVITMNNGNGNAKSKDLRLLELMPPGNSNGAFALSHSAYNNNTNRSLLPPPQQISRANSYQSSCNNSVATDMSMISYVSDIRQSIFYVRDETTGRAEFVYPNAHVHLMVANSARQQQQQQQQDNKRDVVLQVGHIAQLQSVNAATSFEDYHRDDVQLPPNDYAIGVQRDLYRRVLMEAGASRAMPCGLFYCGHYEDVSRPSICLAIALIVGLLVCMGYAAALLHD